MREFVFALEYDPGTNPVADVLETHPETTIRSLSCHVTEENLWRVDHATGSPEALDALESAYLDAAYFADCLVKDDCGAECEIQVLDRSAETLVVYTAWERTGVCTSVPHLALDHLGQGLLFETHRERRRYTWRIVLPNGTAIHSFFDALGDEVGECTGIEMLRLTDLDPDPGGLVDDGSLPDAQREALQAAVDHGYYETPRQIELSDLAAELGVPRSTLSYRLRRAEAELATAFADTEDSLDSLAPGL